MNIIKKYVIISPSGVPAPVAGPRNYYYYFYLFIIKI